MPLRFANGPQVVHELEVMSDVLDAQLSVRSCECVQARAWFMACAEDPSTNSVSCMGEVREGKMRVINRSTAKRRVVWYCHGPFNVLSMVRTSTTCTVN
jgi:hypothetical protein